MLTFCMVLSLVPMSALAAGDTSSDSNTNTADNAIVNGSFEQPAQKTDTAPQLNAETVPVPGWSTTATDGKIEFGVNIGTRRAPPIVGERYEYPERKPVRRAERR